MVNRVKNMRTANPDDFPKLTESTKLLISNGVYSLFSINNRKEKYAVVIGSERKAYLLDDTGFALEVIYGDDIDSLEINEILIFNIVDEFAILVTN